MVLASDNDSGYSDADDVSGDLVLEEQHTVYESSNSDRASDSGPKERFINHSAGLGGTGGSSYIDDVVLRDRDANAGWTSASDGVLEERRYLCQNWRHDVSAVLTDTGKLVESVKYSAYGVPFALPVGDVDSDGDWDSDDASAMGGSYLVAKDADLDGTPDASSDAAWADSVTGTYQILGRGVLSASTVKSRRGYAGYEHASALTGTKMHVRHRFYNAALGRWNQRDPLGYIDGMGLYEYVGSQAVAYTDPQGLIHETCNGEPGEGSGSMGAERRSGTRRDEPNPRDPSVPSLEPVPIFPVPPPTGIFDFHWYGNHCGGGHGSSYWVTCSENGSTPNEWHLQFCGKNGPINQPGQECRAVDDIDKCCRDHDECAYRNCNKHKFFCKSPCQKLCDDRICTCLNNIVREGTLTSEQRWKVDAMRMLFCGGNSGTKQCDTWTPPTSTSSD